MTVELVVAVPTLQAVVAGPAVQDLSKWTDQDIGGSGLFEGVVEGVLK
ncbi:hypothetical protein KR51_00016800 [Rubidibacter lacunae KORDI 51-2]|uniref:Uncharacterized protein n=1 Tax=Rubidibacter lacunae KORDI 51-2 TaxID=582515 RepID=U5DPR9_9CHRO|nr:hypothetical protein [Rubidibacter lacunae]ERN41690.1 hypothetical protein KR51_00016800 [Rubidibacter lacunae KORDI 51-2]